MFFTAQKKGRNNVLVYLSTIFITGLAYAYLGYLPLVFYTRYQVSKYEDITSKRLEEFSTTMDFGILHMDQNLGLFLMMLIFVIAMAAFYLCIKFLHKWDFKAVITPYASINWRKILFAFGLWFLLSGVIEFIVYLTDPLNYIFSFDLSKFLILLAISLLLIPIQTSWEEIIMRGYLMPAMGRWIGNKWVPLLITSLIFGMLHGFNPEVSKYGAGIMFTYYIGAGLFLGIITIMDDSLELALGVHAATNIFGALFVTFEGSVLQTHALFKVLAMNAYVLTVLFFIVAAVFYVICYKKYNWEPLSTIFKPLPKE